MDSHTLHRRLAALVAGALVALAFVVGVFVLLPAQSTHDESREYGYVYSGAKSSSAEFLKATMSDSSLLVFGSSELSTPASLVPEVSSQVFGTSNYGLSLQLVGEAYDQSLWHTIALGALSQGGVPRNKVVLIVSPGWFVDGGQDSSTFQTRFSYSLYREFCSNEAISDQTKAYVRERLASLGVDDVQLDAASCETLRDRVNDVAYAATDDLRLRSDLVGVRDSGTKLASTLDPTTPDFAQLRAKGLADGEAASTSNDWGVEDSFWNERLAPTLDSSSGVRTDETYSDTPEYDDLDCFLDVCDSCGIEPLVVICPEMGPYYDHIGIDATTRAGCYDRIRQVCEGHDGVTVADFSDREYERYFLYDIVHLGWTGWVDVEQSIYEFAEGQ